MLGPASTEPHTMNPFVEPLCPGALMFLLEPKGSRIGLYFSWAMGLGSLTERFL